MENTQSNRYIGIGINVLRRRGRVASTTLKPFAPVVSTQAGQALAGTTIGTKDSRPHCGQ